MKPLVDFPDARMVALRALRAQAPRYAPGLTFVTRDYDPDDINRPAFPYAVVNAETASGRWPVSRTVPLRIVVHADTDARAAALASLCMAYLLAYDGDAEVRGFSRPIGPTPTTDPDTDEPVAFFTVSARLRPRPIALEHSENG